MSNLLFSIPVGGHGSQDIESLPSYLCRISYWHGISVGQMLTKIAYLSNKYALYESRDFKISTSFKASDLLRHGKINRRLTQCLASCNGVDLTGTSMPIFGTILTRSRGELVKDIRWCPFCLEEMVVNGVDPYFKLAWQFNAISFCDVHKVNLQHQCLYCGSTQFCFARNQRLEKCQKCSRNLYEITEGKRQHLITANPEDVAYDVWRLIGDVATRGGNTILSYGVHRSCCDLQSHFSMYDRGREFYRLLNHPELTAVIYFQQKLCFNSVRILAANAGVPLYDFLNGEAKRHTANLDFDCPAKISNTFLETQRKNHRDHQKMIYQLNDLASSASPPLSLKAVARRLAVSVGYLEYRFPNHAKLIVDKYRAYQLRLSMQKRYRAQVAALRYFGDNSKLHSRREAYRVLSDETGLPKWVLKSAIQTAYGAMQAEGVWRPI
jgi:Ribosomal protein S27.